MHFAGGMSKHFKFLRGLGDVNANAPFAFLRGASGEAQQFGQSRVGRVWRKRGAMTRMLKQIHCFHGFAQNIFGSAFRFDAGHFEKGKNAQRRGIPNFGQQIGHALDIGDGGRAGFQKLMCAAQPRARVVGITPTAFCSSDGANPIDKSFWRRQFASHVGIIKMAMGVDEARQEDNFAKIKNFFAEVRAQILPRCDGADFIAVNENRAVLNGRRGDGKNYFRP